MGGACCLLAICCPPDRAAKALAKHLSEGKVQSGNPYEDIALRLTTEFVLVPRSIAVQTESGDPVPVSAANDRLAKLHAHGKAELREILAAAGHSVAEPLPDEIG